MQEEIELKAANTLLEKGIRFPVRAPWWLRLFGKKTISLIVRHPYSGTLYFLSKYYLEMGIDMQAVQSMNYDEAFGIIGKSAKNVSKILAVCVLNNYWLIKLFTRPFAAWLRWRLTPVKQHQLFVTIVNFSGVEVFTNTIRFAGQMRTTAPKMSEKEEGI